MIADRVVHQAEYIIDESGIVGLLIDGYRTNNKGRRPPAHKLRLMLIAMFLTVHKERTIMLANSYRTLSTKLSVDTQIRIGFRDRHDTAITTVTLDDFYNLERTLCDRLCWVDTPSSEIPAGDHARRRKVITDLCDAVMDVFPTDWESSTVAIDATGLHAWGRRLRSAMIDLIDRLDLTGTSRTDKLDRIRDQLATINPASAAIHSDNGTDNDSSDDGLLAPFDDADPSTVTSRWFETRREWEARWGVKTSKEGKDETFFGYHEHTSVLAPQRGVDETPPPMIQRFRITPANADVVDPTFELIDTAPTPVTEILVDRHYHYKAFGRWGAQLALRGIKQHLDLRANELGFEEFEHMRWAAGVAHCPGTPDELGPIARPGFQASRADKQQFARQIAQRQAFALDRHTSVGADGKQRLKCPAIAGKIGCPLRPGTTQIAIGANLPIVDEPPSAETHPTMPACCTQQTVVVTPPESIRKLVQPHYWGSETWTKVYDQRTYVEGSYGIRKNPSAENVDRGQNQVFGLVWLHIAHTLINASYNLNRLTTWAEKHPDHPNADHQLLHLGIPDPTVIGAVTVTADEYAHLLEWRERSAAAVDCVA